jgi:hypothetical protein
MTEAQCIRFTSIAQTGMAQGLTHPIEWYAAYCRALSMTVRSKDIAREEAFAEETFIEFLRMTPSGPDDPIRNLDAAGLTDMMEAFYDKSILLRQAVEHYADPRNWRGGKAYHKEIRCKIDPIECNIIDHGKVARDTLEKLGFPIPGENPREE